MSAPRPTLSAQNPLPELLALLQIESPSAFSLAGRRFLVEPPAPGSGPAANSANPALETAPIVSSIANVLYRFAYSRPLLSPLPAEDPVGMAPVDFELLSQLMAAGDGQNRWEEGWHISELLADGRITARRGHEEREVWPGQYLSLDGPRSRPRVGGAIRLFYSRDSTTLQPGFYYRFSATPEAESFCGLIRVYWNTHREGAARLIDLLPPRLDAFQVPFRLKFVTLQGEMARIDPAVLYVSKRDAPLVFALALELHAALRDSLEEAVPLFSLPLAEGVGLAEDPLNGESFGQQRCRVVAEATWASFVAGKHQPESRLAEARRRFAAAGVDPDRLYRNAGPYDVFLSLPRLETGKRTKPRTAKAKSSDFLEAAFSLGARLCRDALWAGDCCNYLGFSMENLGGRWHQAYRAYGPDLYGGTAGIGLFLARLYAATGERLARHTARGALRHALNRAADVEVPSRWGLYTGWPGLSLAALEASVLLGEEELAQQAWRLLRELRKEQPAGQFDLLAGLAGAIPLLILAGQKLPDSKDLLELAVSLGDTLIAAGQWSEIGLSWGDAGQPGSRLIANLAGYSHGAAGIGLALLELWRACGEPRFQAAFTATLNYERFHFDAVEENWPDLRLPEQAGAPVTAAGKAFMKAWCHGAPGIGLARLRAFEILGEQSCLQEAETAIRSTERHFVAGQEMSQTNYSLCHGVFGNADLLLEGARVLSRPALRAKAEALGRQAIEEVLLPRRSWPCGTMGQVEVPGLMLGLAGIGHFYLRLAEPDTTSLLLLRPD